MHELWLKLHRWIGLSAGLFFGIAALTGAILVYENELDAWLNGSAWETTPGDIGGERILERALQSGTLIELRWPQLRDPIYYAEVRAPDGSTRTLRLDPGSGDEVNRSRPHLPILAGIRRLHTSLLVGPPGRTVVVIASALALFSMIAGVILWWPGLKRFAAGFKVRTRRGFYPFNFDLHQSAGALVLPVLFLITLTGVLLSYAGLFERGLRKVVGDGDGVRTWETVTVSDAPAASPQLILRSAMAAVSDAEPVRLRLPGQPGRPALAQLLRGSRAAKGTLIDVVLDPGDGAVLQVRDPQQLTRAERLAKQLTFNLHVGAVGGPLVRALYSLVCLAGALLVVTGVMIWWLKRTRIEAVTQQKSAARPRREGVPAAGK